MDFAFYVREIRRLSPPREGGGPDNLIVLERVVSTNSLARAIAAEYGKESAPIPSVLLLAWEQTGGRGRSGRSWESPAGRGVYATLAFAVPDPEGLATLPLLVGVGLCRALDRYLPSGRCGLKWPNDLVVAGRKLGGVLIEAQVRPGERGTVSAIVGFGINVGQEASELPEGRYGTTSLRVEGVAPGVSLPELTWALVGGVEHELAHLGDAGYAVARYRERSVHRQGEHLACRVGGETVEGTFLGFDERGLLRLGRGGGELRLSAGDVVEEVTR